MIKHLTGAVLQNFNKPLKLIKNISIPNLKKDQVLVKMKYTAICGSQLFEINGQRGKNLYLPHLLGHEGTGYVVKTGFKNSKFKKNDKVFLSWIKSNKKKYNKICYTHPNKKRTINAGPVTTFSNYTIVSDNCVYKLPKKINLKKGVLLGCALPTGAGMVFNQSEKLNKKNVLVVGAGGIGVSSILALKAKKTKKIIVYEVNKKKIIFLKKFFKNIDFCNNVDKLKKNYFDYVFECSGKSENIELGFELLKNDGKCIFATHPKFNKKITFNPHDFIKGKKIEGSWGGNVTFSKDLKKLTKLILNIKFIEKIFFKKSYSLLNINKAILDFKNGKNIRTLIKLG